VSGKGGRPVELTQAVQDRVCNAIKGGNYYEAACEAAGIGYSTFRRWMISGEKQKKGPFRAFWEAVRKAEAEAEVLLVLQWQAKTPEDWRAARDLLARRFPDRWGPKEKHEFSGKAGGPIQFIEVVRDSGDDADGGRDDA
jgi:transposase